MKVIILCGGQGSRIRDISDIRPKPMLSVGNRPILWHIMSLYAHFGWTEFILCLGYKGWMIKEFFLNYYAMTSDFTFDLANPKDLQFHHFKDSCPWKITFVDTGEETMTGGRVKSVESYVKDDESFCLTYGDGLADVDLRRLYEIHRESGRQATITGVHPSGRFGEIETEGSLIREFNEKPNVGEGLINGGFMILQTSALSRYFTKEASLNLEKDVLPRMVRDREVGLYRHEGFWQCMDTPREYLLLNEIWKSNKAPWKLWS